MTAPQSTVVEGRPLRLWPGVSAAALTALLWFVVPRLSADIALASVFGAMITALIVILWWLFFSRAPWIERLGVLILSVPAVIITKQLVDPSIAGGAMGFMLPLYAVPTLSMALVAGLLIAGHRPVRSRRAIVATVMLLACASFTLIRTGGIMGVRSEIHFRWTPTPEERLLAQAANEKDPVPPPAPPVEPVTPVPAAPVPPTVARGEVAAPAAAAVAPAPDVAKDRVEWPGFRGPARNSVLANTHIEKDWTKAAPAQIWRRPIGPGWSSFAVHGGVIYTQEQRGEDEVVAAYDLNTGAPVWRHRDAARFYESNGGPGPRATPTYYRGRLYTFGATGILNALDARNGAVIWSRNAASDTETKTPGWGFASSPLIVHEPSDQIVIAAAGTLASYELATGKLRWIGPKRAAGYSSPQFMTIAGVNQILLLNGDGATSVSVADGKLLWDYKLPSGARIVQPASTSDGDVLINVGEYGSGNSLRRLAISRDPQGEWKVEERWSSNGLKPDFNDYVVHKGYAYGFDGAILSCVDLQDGKRKWKGGRYGQGQMMLLADQDLLLVVSEEGELALVSATPDQFTEVARMPAIEGKTWNHPVIVGDVLLVRNGEEMAAFRLASSR